MTNSSTKPHIPVLLTETATLLDIQPTDVILDGTIGYGGHSAHLMSDLGINGRLIGLDQDPNAIAFCQKKFSDIPNIELLHLNFADLGSALHQLNLTTVDKILIDLGMSSFHLDASNRGFSFSKEEPLDMRMNPNDPETAADILNSGSKQHLTTIFSELGDIRTPDKLVHNILSTRQTNPFKTTANLIAVIKPSFYFRNKRRLYIKTLSQVFQALRMAVNHELDRLTEFLTMIPEVLVPNGRIAIITFHSGEDRLVKRFFQGHKDTFKLVGNKVISPKWAEKSANPRSRSAKLRVYQKS